MNNPNILLASDIAFSGPYTSSLEPPHQESIKKQKSRYRGTPVQVLDPPLPAYLNQPDRHKNKPDPLAPLHKLDSTYQIQVISSSTSGIDIPDIPQSILDDDYSNFDHDFSFLNEHVLCDLTDGPNGDNSTLTGSTTTKAQHTVQKSDSEPSSVIFSSQSSSRQVSVLNKGTKKKALLKSADTASAKRSGKRKGLPCSTGVNKTGVKKQKKPVPDIVDHAKKSKSKSDNRVYRIAYNSEYHYTYNHKLKELVAADIFEQAKAVGKIAGQLASSNILNQPRVPDSDIIDPAKDPAKDLAKIELDRLTEKKQRRKASCRAYTSAYNNAYNNELKELVSSDIFDQAKAAGQAAGRVAGQAAQNESMLAKKPFVQPSSCQRYNWLPQGVLITLSEPISP